VTENITSPRRGRTPTELEKTMLDTAADDLSPAASLSRVESAAKLVFAAVAGTAGLLTALGLNADVRTALLERSRIWELPWPAAALVLSLVLGGLALVPSLRRLNLNSPSEIASFYDRAIRLRGSLVVSSLLLLAIGSLGAAAAVLGRQSELPQLATVEQTTGQRTSIRTSARVDELPRGGSLTLVLRSRAEGETLCRATETGGAPNAAAVECSATVPRGEAVTVTATLRVNTRTTRWTELVVR
jgi:hypothetical protein